jgi:hypothetical protein
MQYLQQQNQEHFGSGSASQYARQDPSVGFPQGHAQDVMTLPQYPPAQYPPAFMVQSPQPVQQPPQQAQQPAISYWQPPPTTTVTPTVPSGSGNGANPSDAFRVYNASQVLHALQLIGLEKQSGAVATVVSPGANLSLQDMQRVLSDCGTSPGDIARVRSLLDGIQYGPQVA